MASWLHRTTKQFLQSVSPNSLPEPTTNYIQEPDLSVVTGFPSKYWILTGNVISLMSQVQRDVVDAAERQASRDIAAQELDGLENLLRAFMLTVLDEFNRHSLKTNAILDAIDNANNLSQLKSTVAAINDFPQRTIAQLRSIIRNKLGT